MLPKYIFYAFLLVKLIHTAGKAILVGTTVNIFNRSFLIYIIKQVEKYLQVFQSRNRIYYSRRHIFPVQLYTYWLISDPITISITG